MDAWPQYAIATILTFNLLFNLVSDKDRATMRDRWTGVLSSFLVFGVYAGLLGAGGFWRPLFH
jgi:uncharacterized membrane protein YfcA